jgi:hypothetical protein
VLDLILEVYAQLVPLLHSEAYVDDVPAQRDIEEMVWI